MLIGMQRRKLNKEPENSYCEINYYGKKT